MAENSVKRESSAEPARGEDSSAHDDARAIFAHVLDRVLPEPALRRYLQLDEATGILTVDGRAYDLARFERILVVGGGKAGRLAWRGVLRDVPERTERQHYRAHHARADTQARSVFSEPVRAAEAQRPDLPALNEAHDQEYRRRHGRKRVQLRGVKKKPKARLREGAFGPNERYPAEEPPLDEEERQEYERRDPEHGKAVQQTPCAPRTLHDVPARHPIAPGLLCPGEGRNRFYAGALPGTASSGTSLPRLRQKKKAAAA